MHTRTAAHPLAALALLALVGAGVSACGKGIGDGCAQNIECSLNADRTCDLSQIGGYCTIPNCTPDSCPPEAMCVEFESAVPRLAQRFCVRMCHSDGDCRGGYICAGLPHTPSALVGPTDPCPDPGNDTQTGTAPTCTRVIDLLSTDGGSTAPSAGYCTQAPITTM